MLADTNLINGLFDVWVILFYQKRLWDRKLHRQTFDAVLGMMVNKNSIKLSRVKQNMLDDTIWINSLLEVWEYYFTINDYNWAKILDIF